MQPEELKSRQEKPTRATEKTLTTKTVTRRITLNQTYELLANELIDHFPERESRRLNNIKRRKHEASEESRDEAWSRFRKARAEERNRKRKFHGRFWEDDEA